MSGQDTNAAIAETPTALRVVRLIDIRENKTALRECKRESPEYKELLESVKMHGVIQTITVRECVDPVTQQKYYGLIDGLQRFTAAKDAGLDSLEVKVITASDFEVLQKQIILNVQRIDTAPAAYSKQLQRMLYMNPVLTLKELAKMIGKSETYIYERLNLLKLEENVAKMVDDGQIALPNAYAMAKLPPEEQVNFKDRAVSQTQQEFIPQVTARVKELADAKRKGQDPKPAEFIAVPRQRKLQELKDEYNNPTVGKELISKTGTTDPVAAFNLGVKWALHMDPNSIEQDKAKDQARKKEQADNAARRKTEREAKAKEGAVAKALGVDPAEVSAQ